MMERFKRLSTYKVQNKIALKQNIMEFCLPLDGNVYLSPAKEGGGGCSALSIG